MLPCDEEHESQAAPSSDWKVKDFHKGIAAGYRVLNQSEVELIGLFGVIALVVNVVAAKD
ncbi:hypothetical protein SAE02_69400 [Skermanella aerolata]|uniref:Uncharacterized protein n=1 Tax=Skermanella aerolata TaxID=393310 RepID=A0A512E248_9PROT|nr:hypothetical protein [Skermanella aerolata]GEO42792.1 hypothetical protein SAE02_69400 [Skermanella aerolata]